MRRNSLFGGAPKASPVTLIITLESVELKGKRQQSSRRRRYLSRLICQVMRVS